MAHYLEITEQHYQRLEAGTSDGSVKIWQQLAQKFNTTIDHLLEQETGNTQTNFNTDKEAVKTRKNPALAAAELSEVSPSVMVGGALDLQDGRADTEDGRRVLELARAVCGTAVG
jgi:DNA-binding XRE family transcriptional regulator